MTQLSKMQWEYAPCYEGGTTRPFDRFTIWAITPDNFDNGYGINTGGQRKELATVRAAPSKPETENIARLIAAAPELLEALQEAEGWIEGYSDDYAIEEGSTEDLLLKQIRTAITKATGKE